MTSEELASLLTDFDKTVEVLTSTLDEAAIEQNLKELDPREHKIFDTVIRPDKRIVNEQGTESLAKVARIPVALQRQIVNRAAAFLVGNPIEIIGVAKDESEQNLLDAIYKIWDDNKLDYESKSLAKKMMSETECAELWYAEAADEGYWEGTPMAGSKYRLRMQILARSLGDSLYPVFSPTGDMIAFGRGYAIKLMGGKEEEHFDIYTPHKTYYGVKHDTWQVDEKTNITGKIPIIYYSQPQKEWYDVQEQIERLETVISNNADTNDYFGSPMVVVNGKVKGFAKKGESGKLLELEDGASVQYLTWNQAPEAVKNEIDNLFRLIYTTTDTPDISFEQMKSIAGNAPSGFALKMMFLGAHLKAADKEEIFGKGIQRRLNYIKFALTIINVKMRKGVRLQVKPKFEYYLPKNDSERIDMLNAAVSGGIMSTETAVNQNPLIEDPEEEMERLKSDGLDRLQNDDVV